MVQQQEEQEQVTRGLERERFEDKSMISQLETQVHGMKDKLREIIAFEDQLIVSQREVSQLKEQLNQSETERQEIQRYAHELLERVKKDNEALEFMVDRRIINKFLVNFVNSQSSQQVKIQMLETMSKILAFTVEEKQTLGLLAKKQSVEDSGAAEQ